MNYPPPHPATDREAEPICILVVDDEPAIRRALKIPLAALGFAVLEASRGEEALHLAAAHRLDAILLDLNMPGIGGMETLRRVRAREPRLPVLVLTVHDEEDRKIEALDSGADDYITKPFSMRECIARVRTAVRRSRAPEKTADAPIAIGAVRISPVKRLVTKSGVRLRLTPKEFAILAFLMANAGRAVTYSRLLAAVWGPEYRLEVDYLRTFVRQLRKKIEDDPSNPRYILTDPYVGYRFTDSAALPLPPESSAEVKQ